MIGIDTNILVRYLTADDAEQLEKVDRLIARAKTSGEPLHVDTIVLCELLWVLKRGYGLKREALAEVIEQLLETRHFSVQNRHLVRRALDAFRSGKGDFPDYLLGERNRSRGCRVTMSFDRGLAAHTNFEQV